MKRRLLIAAIFLLAGAVVNVAVAWAIAGASTNYDAVQYQALERPNTSRLVRSFTCFGCEFVMPIAEGDLGRIERLVAESESIGRQCEWVTLARDDWSRLRKSKSPPRVVVEEACGWPRLALRWYLLETATSPELHGGLQLGGRRRLYALEDGNVVIFSIATVGDRTLPLIPIWSGFAVNTIIYAVVLWLLGYSMFAARRLIRVKHGLCPACGYPVGESAVCSECGKALTGDKEAAT